MVILFKVLHGIYCQRDLNWLKDIPENEIPSVVVYKFLGMNSALSKYTRWLDKYVFTLPPKMFCALAWSVLPKYTKTPQVKYIKKIEDVEEYCIIITGIRKHLQLSDNDFKENRKYIIKYIEDNKLELFKSFGIPKIHWKKHGLDFNEMKTEKAIQGKRGLDLFF